VTDPERSIGLRSAIFLVIASMVGTGVFTTSGFTLRDVGSPSLVLLAWALGGLLALAGALSYAELVAALPENGGEYALLTRIYHPAVGFTAGVIGVVVGFAAPIALTSLAFGRYVDAALPGVGDKPLALGMLTLVVFLQRDGKLGAQDALTFFKFGLLLLLLAIGLPAIAPTRLAEGTPSWGPMAVALVYVSYSYSGWNAAAYVAGELHAPQRTVPLALGGGAVAVTGLYLLLNLAILGLAPASVLSGNLEVAALAASASFGETAGQAVTAAVAFGLLANAGALLRTGSRILSAMGRRHPLAAPLGRRSLAVLFGLAVVMILTSSFEPLLEYAGVTLTLTAALTVAGVIVLRWREPELERPYRVFAYPLPPLLFLALAAWMIVFTLMQRPWSAGAAVATLAAGFVLYGIQRR
jgi:APA family basic amino acid/polyamine antiporter